ncbi:MAG TPA: hypothetical protein VME40_12385 [Caulobacteraceae bacterium]|nr:hypothetical protein [Caulobacteraceae bacterium]
MSKFSAVLTATFVAAASGAAIGAAHAQPSASSPATSATAPPVSQGQSAPAAIDRATLASAMTTEPANAIVTVTTDANGDRHVLVASPPVPDTPANRAKYGQPLSRAGRRTAPIGD